MRVKIEGPELFGLQACRDDEIEGRSAVGTDVLVVGVAKRMRCQLKEVEGRKVDVGLGSGSDRLGWGLEEKCWGGLSRTYIFRASLKQRDLRETALRGCTQA
jgi:hypothetical protein